MPHYPVSFAQHINHRALGMNTTKERELFAAQTVIDLYQNYLAIGLNQKALKQGEYLSQPTVYTFTVGQILFQLGFMIDYKIELIKALQKAKENGTALMLPTLQEDTVSPLPAIKHLKTSDPVFEAFTQEAQQSYNTNKVQLQRKLKIRVRLVMAVCIAAAMLALGAAVIHAMYFLIPLAATAYLLAGLALLSVRSPDGRFNVDSVSYKMHFFDSYKREHQDSLRTKLTTELVALVQPGPPQQTEDLSAATVVSSVARLMVKSFHISPEGKTRYEPNGYTTRDEFAVSTLAKSASKMRG